MQTCYLFPLPYPGHRNKYHRNYCYFLLACSPASSQTSFCCSDKVPPPCAGDQLPVNRSLASSWNPFFKSSASTREPWQEGAAVPEVC